MTPLKGIQRLDQKGIAFAMKVKLREDMSNPRPHVDHSNFSENVNRRGTITQLLDTMFRTKGMVTARDAVRRCRRACDGSRSVEI